MCLLCGLVLLVFDEYGYKFELGKVKLLWDGLDVLFIFFGLLMMCMFEVVKQFEVDYIKVVVLYVLIIKLFDIELIV